MSIKRVKPGGWLRNQTLQSAEINDIDEKITKCLDLRSGETNTIHNDINFEFLSTFDVSGGSSNGLKLSISNLELNNDLYCDAPIVGVTEPIKLGYSEETVASANHTLSAYSQIAKFVKLVGNVYDNTFVRLPVSNSTRTIKYEKIITNNTNKTITLFPNITLPVGRTIDIYYDGANLYQIGGFSEHAILYIYNNSPAVAHGTTFATITTTTWASVTSSLIQSFSNCRAGDLVEVSYSCNVYNSTALGSTYLGIFYNSVTNVLQQTTRIRPSTNRLYLNWSGLIPITSDGNLSVGLSSKTTSGNSGYLAGPCDFTVKYIRV